MSGDTHAAAGLAAGLAVVVVSGQEFNFITATGVCWSVVGSLFPDLDQPYSKGNKLIAKVLPFVLATLCLCVFKGSRGSLARQYGFKAVGIVGILLLAFFCKTRPHREFSHSVVAIAAGSLCVLLCSGVFASLLFSIGYLSHLGLDLFNVKGESLLYPSKQKFCLRLCSADGVANKIIRILCSCLSVLFLAGGVLR